MPPFVTKSLCIPFIHFYLLCNLVFIGVDSSSFCLRNEIISFANILIVISELITQESKKKKYDPMARASTSETLLTIQNFHQCASD